MTDSKTFYLNCYVQGDESYDPFPVLVSPSLKISELIHEVVQAYDRLATGNRLLRVDLYQIDVSLDEQVLANLETPPAAHRLRRARRVESYWSDPGKINDDGTHILATAEIIPILDQAPRSSHVRVDPVSEISLGVKELSLRQEQTAQGFRDAPSASAAAAHQAFEEQQARDLIPIYNGRPQNRTELPIQLFHPAFDFFATQLKQSGDLTPLEYQTVEKVLFSSQAFYDVEKTRWKALKERLSAVVGYQIHVDPIAKYESNGVVTFAETYFERKAYGVIIEIKNEIGTGDSDPWVRGAQSYSRYWSQIEMTELRLATRCPSLIISIAGPWMCVSGAVYLDHVVVQPLTDYLWLGNHPQQDQRLTYMTRVFHAIKATVSYLQEYYTPYLRSTTSLSEDHNRFFPHTQCLQTPREPLKFSYKKRLGNPNVLRPVFEGNVEDGTPIVIKFAQFYNFEAHQLLADQLLAPKLLSCSAEPVGGGLLMIVMELSGTSLDNYLRSHPKPEPSKLAQVRGDIERALHILHAKNLVFGDLRPPNVLIKQNDSGTLGGQLVDFDWCGVEGEEQYPVGMNQTIAWAPGVQKGMLLFKQHDTQMLEKLFL
ncbi:hypothetical protein FRC11_005495 [Ceratobasidium sp. 423]|nr:hypothetical protein FRC11_005495 [Ceratobasidium sp. 423]